VVHQTYVGNLAIDSSGFFNHGLPLNVTAQRPGFSFNQADSRINIPLSRSLNSLDCIRAAVRFQLQPNGPSHRYNLSEGFESFALFINPDLSLSGTIYDAQSNWTGATSAPNLISANTNHVAGIECDGINMVRVLLDGNVVAENYQVSGAVLGVGNLGLTIGHWPNPENEYAFEGVIFEFLLQKYDPAKDLTRGLDACCFDRQALSGWYKRVAAKGASRDKMNEAAEALKKAALQAVILQRGGTKAGTTAQQTVSSAFSFAVARRDLSAMEAILRQAHKHGPKIPKAEIEHLSHDLQTALDAFGLDWGDWCQFLAIVCLDLCKLEKGN
jgi:hypothetical protein